jgi:hypothetical protein
MTGGGATSDTNVVQVHALQRHEHRKVEGERDSSGSTDELLAQAQSPQRVSIARWGTSCVRALC